MTLAEHKAATKAKRAAAKAAFVADFGAYYADSASQSVLNDFRSGNFVTIHVRKKLWHLTP